MEAPLHCNNTACRNILTDRAVVTTCSHIFCTGCADESGLARSSEANRHCPACRASLTNPDDAVTTILQPTEDYKTSVLSGLDPSTIMECAGRALAFWTYQTTQEIFYQEYLGKNLTEKYGHLSAEMDKIIHQANTEIQTLQNKIGGLTIDQKTLHQKNNELIEMYREKSKKHAQTQQLYDTLKKRILMSQVQTAASDNVTQTLKSMAGAGLATGLGRTHHHIPVDRSGVEQLHRHQRNASGSQNSSDAAAMPPPGKPLPGHRSHNISSATPLHRTHLPGTSRTAATRSQIPLSTSHGAHFNGNQRPSGSAPRQALGSSNVNSQALGSANGFGLSAGMKISRPPGTSMSNIEPRAGPYGSHLNVSDAHSSGIDHERSFRPGGLY